MMQFTVCPTTKVKIYRLSRENDVNLPHVPQKNDHMIHETELNLPTIPRYRTQLIPNTGNRIVVLDLVVIKASISSNFSAENRAMFFDFPLCSGKLGSREIESGNRMSRKIHYQIPMPLPATHLQHPPVFCTTFLNFERKTQKTLQF